MSFGQLPNERVSIPEVTISPFRILPFFSSIYSVKIANPGPVALYSIYPTVYFDSQEDSRDFISILPPFSNTVTQVELPFSILGNDTPNIIQVNVGTSNAQITTNKNQIVTESLLVILVAIIILVIIVLIRLRKIKIDRIFATIGNLKNKFNVRANQKTSQNKDNPEGL